MVLTEEEKGYDINTLKESIEDCRQNKATFNMIVNNPNSSKEDIKIFSERINIENQKIWKYEHIIKELEESGS